MSASEQSLTARTPSPRAPYESPRIESSASFERYALACTGGDGGRPERFTDCAVGVKRGRSGRCNSCTNGS